MTPFGSTDFVDGTVVLTATFLGFESFGAPGKSVQEYLTRRWYPRSALVHDSNLTDTDPNAEDIHLGFPFCCLEPTLLYTQRWRRAPKSFVAGWSMARGRQQTLTPLYVKTVVQAAKSAAWRTR